MSSKIRKFLDQQPSEPAPNTPKNNMDKYKKKSQDLQIEITGRGLENETLTVPEFHRDMRKMQDKSIIFYGPSGSGKTMIIYDLMFRARNMFPRVIVFAPTNREKKDYEGFVPKELIYEEFTIDDIRNIYEYQRAAASTYNIANNIKILHKLFSRIANPPQKTHLRKLTDRKEHALREIKTNFSDIGEQRSNSEKVEKMYKKQVTDYYKNVIIKPNKHVLENMNLSHEESIAVKYLDFNPRILVVFDDAMTEIKKLMADGRKVGDNVIQDFFFKGRWAYITHFYAFQDDNRLDTDIKKNSFYSIFTSRQVATSFFTRTSSNFGKQDKARADSVINKVFSHDEEDDPRNKFRKLVFSRMEDDQFQYVIADLHGEFQMCSKHVRDYCKKVQKDETMVDRNNPYLKQFTDY